MADVTVVEREPGIYTVTIGHDAATSTHTVRVPTGLPDALGCGHVPTVELIRCSFSFLLEREPPSSILRSFSLEQIGDYFPEFPATIRRVLGGKMGL